MARRLLLLFAALLALLAGVSTSALAGAPASPAPGAQNCARAFLSAAPNHAGANRLGSPCTHPGSIIGTARIAAGCCVGAEGAPQEGEGLVYRRTDLNGGKPYVGQTKNEVRFRARQQEHARGNPYSDFRYEVLGREAPGAQLERLEEYFIRQEGGPANLGNPFGGLANRRHQMRDQRYLSAGGGY